MMELPNYIRTLEKVGVSREQAEAHVQINFEYMEKKVKELATKGDIFLLRGDVKRLENEVIFIKGELVRLEKKMDDGFSDVNRRFDIMDKKFELLKVDIISELSKVIRNWVLGLAGAASILTAILSLG